MTDLELAQANGTEETQKATRKLLNYCEMHPGTQICYHASYMALKIHSDASYLFHQSLEAT